MKLRYLSFPTLLACSFIASANGYVGFSVGSTNVKADLTSIGGGTVDESTGLVKFYGGYRFNKYMSLEGAYFGLAQVTASSVGTVTGTVSGAVDMAAWGLYGVAFVPLGKRTEAYVKAGGANWDADLASTTETATTDGLDALYGLGISYAFTRTFKGTADWEVIDSPNPEFSTYSLGFKWEFN
jgi:hypothetical protein